MWIHSAFEGNELIMPPSHHVHSEAEVGDQNVALASSHGLCHDSLTIDSSRRQHLELREGSQWV